MIAHPTRVRLADGEANLIGFVPPGWFIREVEHRLDDCFRDGYVYEFGLAKEFAQTKSRPVWKFLASYSKRDDVEVVVSTSLDWVVWDLFDTDLARTIAKVIYEELAIQLGERP